MTEPPLPLAGLKVVDAATLFAGPMIASIMGDFGADVIKVEHPSGDNLRSLGWQKDGVSLWWVVAGRNKRSITLSLSHPEGQELMKRVLADADVFIEGFRPGTLERWNLEPNELHEINPNLVVVRTSGFGQTGPYARLPGFGTLAESISGYAFINGWPDGPPTLPPFALADGVAALTGTFAVMFALRWRDQTEQGTGQVIDLAIYEPLFSLLGPQATVYDQLGIIQERTGNAAPFSAPRNAYRASDGRWLGLSASAQSIAERVMRIIGREDLIVEPWFADHTGRVEHADELDALIQDWVGRHTTEEVLAAFAEHEAAIAPINSIEDISCDPQFAARETITAVDHPVLGEIKMQNVIPRLSRTPGQIRRPAPEIGEHNREVYVGELGLSEQELAGLAEAGII
ncbi:MAG: CoA transferase [Actinomycetia bacterium]|nr:CoA transferase [Actinomycetes bacterium]